MAWLLWPASLAFRLVVDTLGVVHYGAGLGTVLLMAAVYWVGAVGLAVWWSTVASVGPLEWVYRRFSDPEPPRLRHEPVRVD